MQSDLSHADGTGIDVRTALPQYEFTKSQNKLIRDISKTMHWVSRLLWMEIAWTFLFIWMEWDELTNLSSQADMFEKFFNIIVLVFQIVVFWLISRFTGKIAFFFQKIVNTKSKDVDNLTDALKQMRQLYQLQRWILMITLMILTIKPFIDWITTKLSLINLGQ